jgi:glucose-6-phosphate 1-dehydrogenase
MRSGKALAEKCTEIIIQFNSPPHIMFPLPPGRTINPNRLILCIQPDEGIQLNFHAKQPDSIAELRFVDIVFEYANSFGDTSIPDAYERLIWTSFKVARPFSLAVMLSNFLGIYRSNYQGLGNCRSIPPAVYPMGSWGQKQRTNFSRITVDGSTPFDQLILVYLAATE